MRANNYKPLTKRQATVITGGLGNPSKMPGKAYGLPAQACKMGAKLATRKGTVCSNCYALKGRYMFANVQDCQARRLRSLDHSDWVRAMRVLIEGEKYFRWHDSGDLQGLDHLGKIVAVCLATPRTRHWLPTRETGMVREYLKHGGVIPDNLVIRVSRTLIDSTAPLGKLMGTLAAEPQVQVSSVQRPEAFEALKLDQGAHTCPAPEQGGHCGDCRACWSRRVPHVAYLEH